MRRTTHTLTAALAAIALAGCSLNLDNAPITPQPAVPIVIRTTPRAPTVQTTPTTTGAQTTTTATTADATRDRATPDRAASSSGHVDDGAPTNQAVLSNPTFTLTLTDVDLTSPEQVAWAYLTERLSYSYRDTEPGAGITRAAHYLTPGAAAQTTPPAEDHPGQDDPWAAAVAARTVATTKITQLTSFRPDNTSAGAETLIVAEWNRVLSSNTGAPLRDTGSTTLTLQLQTDNTWRVSDPGFPEAG